MYKIGDTVRVKDVDQVDDYCGMGESYYESELTGKEHVITDIDEDQYVCLNGWWIKPENLIPVTQEVQVDNTISTVKDSNPKSAAATRRLDLSLFPMTAIAYGALGMTEGDYKYRAYNYRAEGVCVSTYIAALGRHASKFYNGEWADKKTKVPHLASMLDCVAIIIDGFERGNITDDRPPSVDMDRLLTEFEEIVGHLQDMFKDGKGMKEGRVTQKELEHE